MFDFAVKSRQNGPGSPMAAATTLSPRDVGEIDTRSPFQSVKAAVTLFGEVVSPKSTSLTNPLSTKKSKAEERVLEKETQHHIMLKELDYYKDQLRHAETAKAQALRELSRANRTLQELTNKLELLSESKQKSIQTAQTAKIRAKELEEQYSIRAQLGTDAWKVDLENERELYKSSTGELIATKQELANLRQDFDAALVDKLSVFQTAEDAQHTAQMNQERQSKLSEEVKKLHEMLDQVKLVSDRDREEHDKVIAEKDEFLRARKSAKEEVDKEIECLREEYEPAETLQEKLLETTKAFRVLQEQLNDIQSSHLYSIKKMASDLEAAKRELQEAVAEEDSLRDSVDSIKIQLEEVKRDRLETEKRALAAESTVEQMQADLEKRKTDLEAAMSASASVIMQLSLKKILAEAEMARNEAEDCKTKAELLKQEAESARIATEEAEEKLKLALLEAEAANAAEKLTEGRIRNHPESKETGPVKMIRLSVEDFDAMNKKIEEFKNQADSKVATAMAQVESINASEKGILEKLEAVKKDEEAVESEIKEALKRAEMAEAAKRAIESELQKRRENGHK
ncbi:hypothetical protein ABFS82_13G137400 [Erythranthe guttata]|uniref:WEB family protein n=2 Tax=Erythranthe guttata TaxID=4155 RepID=A0A022QFZ9_ERYGU|nr:PREDICTED: WEB family protein At1g12150 isoform X2 [Erythranthe guttata]XP_012849001.1 PREDICTED: WEB family protein At1g12150 isoform X2 [Erythranthe guttata]EYU27651.1 hypothetical protein MIMGU_mgv1a003669mg [Erythranthe guttata]EYU27652.1 hypothetical protein MIMGU_mgv1a003669mg [Erythranthe guttata]|eukprot:XP_012849000.1 PREDICTED: WEB family protein At1g12150 isoform X2 [Erythranthe guttata]